MHVLYSLQIDGRCNRAFIITESIFTETVNQTTAVNHACKYYFIFCCFCSHLQDSLFLLHEPCAKVKQQKTT